MYRMRCGWISVLRMPGQKARSGVGAFSFASSLVHLTLSSPDRQGNADQQIVVFANAFVAVVAGFADGPPGGKANIDPYRKPLEKQAPKPAEICGLDESVLHIRETIVIRIES